MTSQYRIAIVIPWFGRDLKGGAEQLAWQIANRLAERGCSVTALASRVPSFLHDWSVNELPEGEESLGERLNVIRFSVKERDARPFDEVNAILTGIDRASLTPGTSPITRREETIFMHHNILMPELPAYIRAHREDFDAFIFLPYLFPSSYLGVAAAGDRAILQPCLHEEAYAYLDASALMMDDAAALLFNSAGEEILARNIYGNSIDDRSVLVGSGIEIDRAALDQARSAPPVIEGPYILCLGRKDTGKNTHLIIRAFEHYVQQTGSTARLVLAGPAPLPVTPETDHVVDMGLVSEDEKLGLLAHCTALVNPSENESFSRVIYEAWFAEKPVIVHEHCLATAEAVKAAGNAGYLAHDERSFAEAVGAVIDTSPDERAAMGKTGRAYAEDIASWERVIDRYMDVFAALGESRRQSAPVAAPASSPKIILYYFSIGRGDAVGNSVIEEYRTLRKAGYDIHLAAHTCQDEFRSMALEGAELAAALDDESTILIYHHANSWEPGEAMLKRARCKRVMRYHNVTPPEFYFPYHTPTAVSCAEGRRQTRRLIKTIPFTHFIADSPHNARELISCGADEHRMDIIAPFHLIEDFTCTTANDGIIAGSDPDAFRALFVGRVAPNKGHDLAILTAAAYLNHYGHDLRLDFIGGMAAEHASYRQYLDGLIAANGLEDCIFFHQHIPFDQLATYYRIADVFLCTSFHEGFCVPILEAQHHGLPVLALARTAVPETAGADQLVFPEDDPRVFAAALHRIRTDRALSSRLARNGHRNFRSYHNDRLGSIFRETVHRIIQEDAP